MEENTQNNAVLLKSSFGPDLLVPEEVDQTASNRPHL